MPEYLEIPGPNTPLADPVPVDPPVADPKPEDPAPEPKAEDPKPEDPKPEDVKEEPKTEEEKKPHKTGSQRARERAERETQARIAAEQRAAALEAQLNARNLQMADPNEPKIEDFENFDAYKAALVTHAQKRASEEVEQRFKSEQAKRDYEAKQAQWQARDAEFSKDKPDWDDAIEDLTEAVSKLDPQRAPGFQALDAALSASELSSALKYHLGKHPEDFVRMASLDPINAIRELAKLEIKIGTPEPPKPKTTNAPPPIAPLGGTSNVTPPKHRRDTYVTIE